MKSLEAYLARLYDTIYSRRGLTIEAFDVVRFPAAHSATVKGMLRFWNGSMLRFHEDLVQQGLGLRKLEYVYHYQQQDGSLVFRYDNAPHYPNISGFPHHKHVTTKTAEWVEPAQPPQLTDVLKEIDAILATGD
jgi:hypothetical protein